MLVDESTGSGRGISMQSTEQLAQFFCLCRTTTLSLVIHLGCLLELLKQLGLTLSIKENLILPKVS
jgi:hypothetical protein